MSFSLTATAVLLVGFIFIHSWNILLYKESDGFELVIDTPSFVSVDLCLSRVFIVIVSNSCVIGVIGTGEFQVSI